MEKLDFNQMETLKGGNWWDVGGCAVGILGMVGAVASTVATMGSALLFAGLWIGGGVMTAYSCSNAITNW